MKKILSVFAAVSALALAATFVSCGDSGDEFNGATDTVFTLGTPSVTAKAYPGINIVSWQPVPNAFKYELYRYETGNVTDSANLVKVVTASAALADGLYYEDTDDLQNKVSYTYKVLAVGGNLSDHTSARDVIAKDSNAGSATVTAIVPPVATSALNLAAYESGYDGSKTKELSDSEKKNYLLTADSTDIYSLKAELAAAIRAKAYLEYDIMLSAGDKYSLDTVWTSSLAPATSTPATSLASTIVNNTVLPITGSVTAAGDYTVYVKAKAKSPYYIGDKDDIVKIGTVTYDVLEAKEAPTIKTAKYTDNGKTIRVIFTPVTLADGKKTTVENYVVYRTAKAYGGYTKASGSVTASDSDTTFFVDDTIENNAQDYTYVVVLTDGTKYGKTSVTEDVGAYTPSFVADGSVKGSVYSKDSDGIENDVKWTITAGTVDTKVDAAYLLTKDANYTGTPVAADFDKTTKLTLVTENAKDGKTYYAYTPNLSKGKAYVLAVFSRDGYETKSVVSDAVAVTGEPSLSEPTLAVSVYDNTVTAASTVTPTKNDVIINVTDEIKTDSDTISNYTYKLYRTKSTVTSDITAGTITFKYDSADWGEPVATFEPNGTYEMKSDEDYDKSQTAVTYTGVYTEADLADGVYAYKVVKTSSKSTDVKTTDLEYAVVDTGDKIAYVPGDNTSTTGQNQDLSASFVTLSAPKSNVRITFVKDNTAKKQKTESHDSVEHVVGYEEETEEAGVTYTLYRTDLAASNSKTEVVYTKVGTVTEKTATKGTYTKYTWNGTVWDAGTSTEYTQYLTYSYIDENLSTGNGYKYIVVASKAGLADRISNAATVSGAN